MGLEMDWGNRSPRLEIAGTWREGPFGRFLRIDAREAWLVGQRNLRDHPSIQSAENGSRLESDAGLART
jgi:hypothetical protein